MLNHVYYTNAKSCSEHHKVSVTVLFMRGAIDFLVTNFIHQYNTYYVRLLTKSFRNKNLV